ncbi:MAG: DNA repair protein RecO [bacterium]
MSNTHYLESWIIRSMAYGEYDCLVGLYSKELGKLNAYAIGVRKMRSKLRSSIVPFSRSVLTIHKKKDAAWGRIIGAKALENISLPLQDFNKMVDASWVCELIDRLTPDEQPSLKKYELLGSILKKIASSGIVTTVFKIIFAFCMLEYSGHGLRVNHCSECLSAYGDTEPVWISHAGVICIRCSCHIQKKIPVSPVLCGLLKDMKEDPWLLETYPINRVELETLMSTLSFVLNHYLGKPLKAEIFAKKVGSFAAVKDRVS